MSISSIYAENSEGNFWKEKINVVKKLRGKIMKYESRDFDISVFTS